MIDWISCFLPLTHKALNAGYVVSVNPDGEVEWTTEKRLPVEGSYSQRIVVKSESFYGDGSCEELYFSGNPSKFLQGHNIFGSDDLRELMAEVYFHICNKLDLEPAQDDRQKLRAGDYRLTRVDINNSYSLPCRTDVIAMLRALSLKAKTRHGRGLMDGGTVYWGKKSQRWTLKAYCKGEEIQAPKHRLPEDLLHTPLTDWADNKLRLEVTIRTKELEKLTLRNASNWDYSTPQSVFDKYIASLDMSEQIALTTQQLLKLPQHLMSTYTLWKDGHDLRSLLSKNTYYRHRRELLEHGIDINLLQDSVDRSNVVPLIRVLEATPAELPDWAFEQRLIHPSARQQIAS